MPKHKIRHSDGEFSYDRPAFRALHRRLARRRRLDLRLRLTSSAAALAMLGRLAARAREMADAEAARRLERQQAQARAAMLDVIGVIGDQGFAIDGVVAALLAGESAPDMLPDE
jgi:hypothetical protein